MHDLAPTAPRRWTRLVAVTGAAALLSTLAACGGGTSGSTAGATDSGERVHGDTLTIAAGAPPNSLDPALVDAAFTTYTMLGYESLLYRAADGSLQPGLAESWEVADGNQQLDLVLRPDVTFSDGTPVSAEAVVASLQHAQSSPGAQATMLLGMTFTATGEGTVSIASATPNPLLAETFSQFYGVGQIVGPAGLENAAEVASGALTVGAGPYVLDPDETVAGDHYTYTARGDYFEDDRQNFDTVVVRVISNPQAVVNALRTGQVDVAIGGDATVASQVESAGLVVDAMPFVFQGLNLLDREGTVSEPLGDVRVRQAINYAIDRETVATAVLGEYGVPTTQTVTEGSDGWSQEAADAYPYDPDKARELLAEAGYEDGFTLPVASATFAGIDTMAQAIKGQLAEVGITVELSTSADVGTYLQDMTSREFPATAIGYGAQPMHLEGQGLFLPTAPAFNAFGTDDPVLTDLYAQAAAADPEARADLDRQMQLHLVENAWFAPVAFSPVLYFSQADIGGLEVSGAAPIASPTDWYATK
ncbi:ABC transporter substrate-binding protein [Angustibacter speluncae]